MGRLLAIDYGTRRVGLALSDPLKMIASPYRTIINKGNSNLIVEIERIIAAEDVEQTIIGLPLGMAGQITEQTKKVEEMYRDKTDEKILEFLQKDSRESFVEIGKKLKLSESAIRRRVKNMVDNGIIEKFTVQVGETNSTSAIVLVSVDSAIDTSKVSVKLTKLTAVKTVYEITGQYDISVIIRAPNITEINLCIDNLRKIPGVIDTNTVIILRTVV